MREIIQPDFLRLRDKRALHVIFRPLPRLSNAPLDQRILRDIGHLYPNLRLDIVDRYRFAGWLCYDAHFSSSTKAFGCFLWQYFASISSAVGNSLTSSNSILILSPSWKAFTLSVS